MSYFYGYDCEHIIEENNTVKVYCVLGGDAEMLTNETFARVEEATVECYELSKRERESQVSKIFCHRKSYYVRKYPLCIWY